MLDIFYFFCASLSKGKGDLIKKAILMKHIWYTLFCMALLVGKSFSYQDEQMYDSITRIISSPLFLDTPRGNFAIKIKPQVYQNQSLSEQELLVIYSEWRYYNDIAYRKAVENQKETSFAVLCHLNDEAIHRQVKARLDLLFLQAEPLYAALFTVMRDKLIRKYYDDHGKLHYPFKDNLLGKSAEQFCKKLFIPQDVPQRFRALGDRSALLLEELEAGDFFSNAYAKTMSIGWRCKEKAEHPYSASTLQQAQQNQYNQELYQLVKILEAGQYQDAAQQVHSSDQLMRDIYAYAAVEVLQNNLSFDTQQHSTYEILSTNANVVHSTLQAESRKFTEQLSTEFALEYDLETIEYPLFSARMSAIERYQQEHGADFEQAIIINHEAQRTLEKIGYNYQKIIYFKGNALQRQLLEESAYLINHGATYYDKSKEPLTQLLIDMADCAIDCAYAGSLEKGYKCANVGWSVLDLLHDIALGLGEGILDGMLATGTYIAAHPLECALAAIFCKTMLAYHVSRLTIAVVITVGRTLAATDYQNLSSDDLVRGIEELAIVCTDGYQELRKKPVKELVTGGVSCAIELYLQGKCARGLQKFYQKTHQKVAAYAKTVDWQSFKKVNLKLEICDIFPKKNKRGKQILQNSSSHIILENEIKHPIISSKRVGSALKEDLYHAFSDIIDNYAQYAKKFDLPDRDVAKLPGLKKSLYQIEGSLDGIDGVFEWIVEWWPNKESVVSHRYFLKNGKITGIPNFHMKKK